MSKTQFLTRFGELDAEVGSTSIRRTQETAFMPRLHVCSLALIAETVSKTGARSLVTLLSPRDTGLSSQ